MLTHQVALLSEAKPTGNFITRKSTSVMLTCLTITIETILARVREAADMTWPCKSTAPDPGRSSPAPSCFPRLPGRHPGQTNMAREIKGDGISHLQSF